MRREPMALSCIYVYSIHNVIFNYTTVFLVRNPAVILVDGSTCAIPSSHPNPTKITNYKQKRTVGSWLPTHVLQARVIVLFLYLEVFISVLRFYIEHVI